MFNCYLHGWSHILNMCPACFPAHIISSSGTTIESTREVLPGLVEVHKEYYEHLLKAEAMMEEMAEALKEYSNVIIVDVPNFGKVEIKGTKANEALRKYQAWKEGG